MRRWAPVAITFVTLVALAARADEKKPKKGDELGGLAGAVPVDEFNDRVKDKTKGDEKPVRGGMIRLRNPSDPKSLCPILDNDEPTMVVYGYLSDSLLARHPETFEFVPMVSRWWKTRDLVHLKDGRKLEGRVVSEDDKKVVVAVGASKWTLARHEVKIDEAAGKVTWVDEKFGMGDIEGKISYWEGGRFTVFVEEKPGSVVEVAAGDVKSLEEEDETGKKTTVSGVVRECVYEFQLRPGVKWHDGRPVTADDVIFTYRDVIMNKSVPCGHLQSYFADTMHPDPAQAIVKVGEDRLRFELRKQYFAALSTVGGMIYILPSHRYDIEKFKGDPAGFAEHFKNHPEHRRPMGNGRYKLAKWEENKYVEVERNEQWWASQKGQDVPWIDPLQPYLDRIRWVTILTPSAGLKALMNGEVDADFEIEQITWVDRETNSEDFQKKYARAKYLGPPYTYVGWNLRRGDVEPEFKKKNFFADARVRTAMTMLIDRQKILDNIHYGLGEMVTGPFFCRGPFCDRSLKPLEYNPEKAKTLLDQAGWIDHDGDGVRDKDGVPFSFTYAVHDARAYHLKIAEIVKQDIEKAGIKVNIKSTDFNSFLEVVNSRKFDAIRFAWGEPDCIDTDPFQIWHSTSWDNKGSNHTGYVNQEVDELIVKARRELDFKKRQRMFKRIHRIIHEDQPYTFLFNLYELYFYDKKFRNAKFYVIGTKPFYLDEWFIPASEQKESK